MTEAEIYDRMTGIFRDVFEEDDLVLTPQMTANDVADWDSLSHIRLILSLEKAFDELKVILESGVAAASPVA